MLYIYQYILVYYLIKSVFLVNTSKSFHDYMHKSEHLSLFSLAIKNGEGVGKL